MANVIKHKRGSGSDPAANNLVLGELAIRTDIGKLFTKMDSGAIAEIAGGGSDIVINTLSSSSATGGGSATFNGSAYRFTLSHPPSVSAQQLLVSINGVIQKPVAGTGQPSEGFSVDGTDIILGDAPATGSDFFILTFKSLGVSEPADNSVTSAKIVDGAIVNADINASAAIAGTKISPNFGSQAIQTTAYLQLGSAATLLSANNLLFKPSGGAFIDHNVTGQSINFRVSNSSSLDTTALTINSSGQLLVGSTITPTSNKCSLQVAYLGNTSSGNVIELTQQTNGADKAAASIGLAIGNNGESTNAADLRFQTANSGSLGTRMTIKNDGNVGIGTTSPGSKLHVVNDNSFAAKFGGTGGGSNYFIEIGQLGTSSSAGFNATGVSGSMLFQIDGSEKMRIAHTTGNVGIGTTSPSTILNVKANYGDMLRLDRDNSGAVGNQVAFRHKDGSGNFAETGSVNCVSTSNADAGDLRFNTKASGGSNTERMRIDSSGKVKIATTDGNPHANADELTLGDPSGTVRGGMTINSGANKDGSIHFGDPDSNVSGQINYDHNGDVFRFYTSSTKRVRIDSDGLKFGNDSAAANALDDYEEGTFTPVYNYSGRSFNYYLQTGKYVKIGKTVHFVLGIGTSSTSGSGTSGPVKIDGLPFTSNARSAVAIRATNFASDPARTATVENGATFMELIKQTSTGTADMTGSSLSTSNFGNIVYAAGHYETDS